MEVLIARIADLNEVLREKSPLTFAPSGILSDGFICDCNHTDYCEDQKRWVRSA